MAGILRNEAEAVRGRFAAFDAAMDEHLSVIEGLRSQKTMLERMASEMAAALLRGNKVLWCGNGGSAADSQHLAAELVGRFRRERIGLASLALTADTSVLTAIGNDYGFEQVFRRQVEALALPGDVLIALSTSGMSPNVCLALEAARAQGVFTAVLTGAGGGRLAQLADAAVCVGSRDTARIQEGHILCGHMLCEWVEQQICERAAEASESAA